MEILKLIFWRKFHRILIGFFLVVVVLGFVHQQGIYKISFSEHFRSEFHGNRSFREDADADADVDAIFINWSRIARRIIHDISVNPSNLLAIKTGILEGIQNVNRRKVICSGVYEHKGYSTKCQYLKYNPKCHSGGLLNYFKFFYCDCEKLSALGYVVLAVWMIALFYMLGNTATDYFCCCLEKLSNLLNLPPTVAGVTLLPFGNGAPDVFASIAAFTGRNSGDVGLNGVLGGAVFVMCVVTGTISLCVSKKSICIDKKCFVRDVCFFLAALLGLLIILIVGEVSVGGAIAFLCIYAVYAVFVASKEIVRIYSHKLKLDVLAPLLPVKTDESISDTREHVLVTDSAHQIPDESISDAREHELVADSADQIPHLQDKLPHRVWVPDLLVFPNDAMKVISDKGENRLWGWNEHGNKNKKSPFSCSNFCFLLVLPLTLPRRLTIPILDEERWSKIYAVASASLAPMLLSFLLNSVVVISPLVEEITYFVAALLGVLLGMLAFFCTKADHPPQSCLCLWVSGGFLMSITWFYIIATELVSLLEAFGVIFGIKPSLLALTVLAWGNSMGDMMSNVSLAINRTDGVQIAISGCYAGPMFNILCGLGISLLIGACTKRPASYVIPLDPSLYFSVCFLILGLIWSLIVLPWSNMVPNKMLGVGLMTIYLVFLAFGIGVS